MSYLLIFSIIIIAFLLAAFIDFVSAYDKEDYKQKVRRLIYKGKTPSKMDAVYCLTQMTIKTDSLYVRLRKQLVIYFQPLYKTLNIIAEHITTGWWSSLSENEKSEIAGPGMDSEFDSWFFSLNPKDRITYWRIYTNSYKQNF